jgi:hypothetical protein
LMLVGLKYNKVNYVSEDRSHRSGYLGRLQF